MGGAEGPARALTRQKGADAFVKLGEFEGFGHIFVHPGFDTLELLAFHGGGGHGDDRGLQFEVIPNIASRLIAVHFRHLNIHYDQVKHMVLLEVPDGVGAVAEHLHCCACFPEYIVDQFLVNFVVFRYEETFACQQPAVVLSGFGGIAVGGGAFADAKSKVELEARAFSDGAGDADVAPLEVEELFADGEPKTCSAV